MEPSHREPTPTINLFSTLLLLLFLLPACCACLLLLPPAPAPRSGVSCNTPVHASTYSNVRNSEPDPCCFSCSS